MFSIAKSIGQFFLSPNAYNHLDLSSESLGSRGGENLMNLTQVLQANISVEILNLSNNEIAESAAGSIYNMLNVNKSITSLDLSGNNLKYSGIESILLYGIKPNETIEKLNLSCNHVGQIGSALYGINEVLEWNKNLSELNFSFNPISFIEIDLIGKGLSNNKNLRVLSLKYSSIDNKSAEAILKGVAKNTSLKILSLVGNEITNVESSVVEGLSENRTLTELDLNRNEIDASVLSEISSIMIRNQEELICVGDRSYQEDCDEFLG